MHGGTTAIGPYHHATTHGKRSAYLPSNLVRDYHRHLNDPDALAAFDEIALVKSRVDELARRLDTRDSEGRMRAIRASWREVQRAQRSGDGGRLGRALDDHGAAVEAAWEDYAAWDGMAEALRLRQRLVESERRRLVEAQLMAPKAEVLALLHALAEIVVKHVDDPDARAAISRDTVALLGR